MSDGKTALQRPPAEVTYADELARLAKGDDAPRPPGWRMSARAVRTFILGDESGSMLGSVIHAAVTAACLCASRIRRS